MTRPAPANPPLDPGAPRRGGGDRLLQLTPQERAVYEVLRDRAGRVVGRAELARRAGIADLSSRRCDSLIAGIRRRIGADRIRTVRRRGWMLVA